MQKKLRVAVLGATGLAGQQFLTALAHHPYFTVTRLSILFDDFVAAGCTLFVIAVGVMLARLIHGTGGLA